MMDGVAVKVVDTDVDAPARDADGGRVGGG